MKKQVLLFMLTIFSIAAYAQNLQLAKRMGGSSSYDEGNSIAVDALGNVYTTGTFDGTANFGSGITLISAGYGDIFVSKQNANGDFLWAKRMGGSDGDQGKSIAVDASVPANVYTVGWFSIQTDALISKLAANGDLLWAKSIKGTTAIAVDALANVYATGFFAGTVNFNTSGGTSNLTSAGSTDIFISKLNADGTFGWAKRMGGNSGDQGNSITLDAAVSVHYGQL